MTVDTLPRRRRMYLLLALGLCASAGGVAYADWPMARHDPQRTATSTAPAAAISKPTIYWRHYLGGSLAVNSHLVSDVNADGQAEVIYIAGGKVIAKLPDDSLVWESPAVEIAVLIGVEDLNGDGVQDVVAYSSRKAFVISGKSGAIEWEEKDGEMGSIGSVRMGDLDKDGRSDLYIEECGCCGVNSGIPGVAYSFGKGFAVSAPLWTAPAHTGCNGNAIALADLDGDGHLDVGMPTSAGGMLMLQGSSGKSFATSASLGALRSIAACDSANVDGRPGEELVCFLSHYQANGSSGGHHVWVTTYDPKATNKAVVLWEHTLSNIEKGRISWLGNSLVDLDKDGKWEVVFVEYDGAAWTTRILDAQSGAELASVAGAVLSGIVDINNDKLEEMLLSEAGSGKLSAASFKRQGSPSLSTLWTLATGESVRNQQDWVKARRTAARSVALALDADQDKVRELVLYKGGSPATLSAYKANSAQPKVVATFSIPEGTSLLTNQVFAHVNRPYEQLLVTKSDGYLVILDKEFKSTMLAGDPEFPETAMRVGGYYSGAYGNSGAAPIAPRLSSDADSILAMNSRGALIRLDAKEASLLSPPKVGWELLGASLPSAIKDSDQGKAGVVCYKGGLTALSSEGKQLWSKPLPGAMFSEALPGDADGDGLAELFVNYATSGSVANFQVYEAQTGQPLWAAPHTAILDWGVKAFAVADYDKDGKADLVAVPNTLRVLRGADGTVLAENKQFFAYFLPVIEDVDQDGSNEITLTGGYYPARTLGHDLTSAKWTGPDDRPYPFGARAVCEGKRSVWVQGSLKEPGLVRLTTMNGTDSGKMSTLVLAEGVLYATVEQANNAKKHRGTIGNVSIKPDLLGAGTHPGALVGSTDGWLYAINPCAGTLDWSTNFRFPVGEPILADSSGDGADEIIVTVADGYLYGLSQQNVPAPAYVHDTDPPAGIVDEDVDERRTGDTLSAKWAEVSEVDSYEVAVVTPGGSFVTQPNWKNVGKVTSADIHGLPLLNGKRYLLSVRAVSTSKGSSTEAISDGVLVTLGGSPAPDGGADSGQDGGGGGEQGGCSCELASVPRSGAGSTFLLLCALTVLLRRRRIFRRARDRASLERSASLTAAVLAPAKVSGAVRRCSGRSA